jgi:hypothetical protein
MKDLKKRIESNISTPIIWYAIILATAVVFLIISSIITHFTSDSNWWGFLFLNFGYGTFASFVVSLLIDIGNTRRNNKILDSKYDLLTSECKNDCSKLSAYAYHRFKSLYKSEKEIIFEDCVDRVLNPEYDHTKINEIDHEFASSEIIFSIKELKKSADRLIDMIPFCYDEKTNANLRDNIKNISAACRDFDYYWAHRNKKYDRLLETVGILKNAIINTFPELKDEFEKPYIIYNSKDVK